VSVLVEALSLIIPRKVLDVSYAGGTDAFLEAMCEPSCPSRLVCSDDKLASVSFYNSEDADVVTAQLLELGLVEVDDNRFYDMAFVDQRSGPTMPCDWLNWEQHKEGFTYAWLAGDEPGDLSAPADWTPEQSRRLVRTDVRDEPGRMLQLADEDGIETWLDFNTGAMYKGLLHRGQELSPTEPNEVRPVSATVTELLSVTRATLDGFEWRYTQVNENVLALNITGVAMYSACFAIDETVRQMAFFLVFAARTPQERRVAIAEALTRANYGLQLGSFEMDFTDGEIRFQVAVNVEGSTLTQAMIGNMIAAGMTTCDTYHDAIMRVMFSGDEPSAAIAKAEKTIE